MTWIVTGGAGFIGAHVVHLLSESHDVVVFDNLSTGRLERLPAGVTVVKGSVTETDDLARLFDGHPASGVVHLAARKFAPDGTGFRPDNIDGVHNLVEAMTRAGVDRLLFASSAAVYGESGPALAAEDQPLVPVNPYGKTKLEGEQIIGETRLRSIALRQFNVVGAGPHPFAADTGPAALLPAVFRSLSEGKKLVVRGHDYPTGDGSAVRDYVHVEDVARAYVRGVELLSGSTEQRHLAVNVASGQGTSVLDLVRLAGRVAGEEVPFVLGDRRPGDAAEVVADVSRAVELGFAGRLSLEEAVRSAWESWPA
ncbi:UDP-glucose 4-epimerase [Actinoplanes lutulentus]|uniref:UDP-glucose 4-epimerase n=1 Tax=Actinoplanes lutulentus TaxID=1287878 RepID=A0A327ZLL4_9ACTN|nr:NAD-dependent epimerase/dehydratase family protein [Actinoplanes lutulentus]MBB2941071.1 UDP-glucose 4-epimerase [Actinoplanes lutulentus]RAK43380.1 UDP-glucose 4-epimerase [Actinoplanes lutulentus]